MPKPERYNPPNCPSLLFFRAAAVPYFLEQNIVPIESGRIPAGKYDRDTNKLIPITPKKVSSLESMAGSEPERMLIVPTYAKEIKVDLPLVHGHVIVYPNHDAFSIREMNHPAHGKTYFTTLSAIDKQFHTGADKDEDLVAKDHENRVEFIHSSAPFDVIERGFLTWELAYPPLRTYGEENLYLVISVDGSNIRQKENRGFREIRRVARNKQSETFQAFLDRLAKLHNEIAPFLAYCDQWAERHS